MSTPPGVETICYQAESGRDKQTRDALGALIATMVAIAPDCLVIRLHQGVDNLTQILL